MPVNRVRFFIRRGLLGLLAGLIAVPVVRADDEVLKPRGSNKPSLKKVKPNDQSKPVAQPGEPARPYPPAAPIETQNPPRSTPSDGERAGSDDAARSGRGAGSAEAASSPGIRAALATWRAGRAIEARTEFNRLLAAGGSDAEMAEIRGYLTKLADETIFSPEIDATDPLIERYKVQSGEVLVKIARKFKVPVETLIALRSGQKELSAGEVIKIPRGPFKATISKSQFRMDVYLQDTFVRSCPVGLGVEGGTPTGVWKIADRQRKPTWYPPASARDRQVRGPNDPLNPLGGYWIKLEGLSGEAVGRTGFGIHGTIEPETVGKEASLGCVRMLPDDIDFVYRSMQPGASTVTVVP